jgi:CRP-like cAMP-binding protein
VVTVTVSAPEARGERARDVLRTCPQLRGLDVAATEMLAVAATTRHYAAGEPVFLEGGPGDAMYVLRRGSVVARISSARGDVIDLGVAAVGDAFGYFEVLHPGPRSEDAVAVRDSVVLAIPAGVALTALRRSPETLLALAGDLIRIVRYQNRAWSGRALRKPVNQRVAGLLLELVADGDVIVFDGPQTLLAQRLGIARQTLNSALRALADRGLIAIHPGGRSVTLDRPALTAYAAR